jgi:hypothetical protein
MSSITTYKNLIDRFATSEALFAHLKSAEGGGLMITVPEFTADNPLAVITYNKEKSNMAHADVEYFRSVIWNLRENRPVCVAPSRGRKFADVEAAAPATFTVEDFVDGVMLNMFHHAGVWRLTTRSRLDADSSFYGKHTFADLFWETLRNAGLRGEDFSTSHCYSWVLQHPDERVVVAPPYGIAKLTLVEAAQIHADGAVTVTAGAAALRAADFVPARAKTLLLEEHTLTSLADVKARVEAWGRRFGGQWQGLVVKAAGPDGQPRRWKLRSAQYDAARQLRGNQANRVYRWMELWGKKLEDYLRLFPEERTDAEAAIAAFKACTQELYDLYQKVYRRRELPLGKAPQKYRKLLWDAHQANAGAYFANTRKFMNDQDTARKVWLINYEKRYGAGSGAGSGAVAATDAAAAADDVEAVRAAVQALAEAVAARATEFPPLPSA